MQKYRWQFELAILLVLLSFVLYVIHYAIFENVHHIFIYLLGDIAFIPLEVLVVSLVVHRALSQREHRAKMEKMNMVIGMFFSELGTDLLACFLDSDPDVAALQEYLQVRTAWTASDFRTVRKRLSGYQHFVNVKELAMGLVTLRPTMPEDIGTLFFIHLFLVSVLIAYIPFSKLMHMAGIFLSPTRNLSNNNRFVRHINPWNYPVEVHTYEEYEDEFREKMIDAGLPVEKMPTKEANNQASPAEEKKE